MVQPIQINLASLNLITLSPMLVTVVGALLILIIDLIKKDLHKSLYVMLAILVLFVDFGATLSLSINERGFFNVMLQDGISVVSQLLILIASMLFLPLALTSKRFHEFSYPEFFALFLFMVAGFQFMVASDNLILIFIGLETASLALYTLIAMHNTPGSHEAAIKYFTMGAMAAGFFVMGAAVLYGLTGSVELYSIAKVFTARMDEPGILLPLIGGAVLLMVAIGFKVSLMPFHLWTPDVYEGSSAPMAGYMSIVPKVAMMVVAMRVFGFYVDMGVEAIRWTIIILAIVTMTLSNMMALVQEDVKRMLAYSSISHAGFVMAALALDTTKAYSSIFLYYGLFLFTNLGAFTMLWISRRKHPSHHERFHHPYIKFSGLVHTAPMGAVIMAVFMLSLAGVPPFSLFWGKLYVISATVDAGYIWLAVIMALNSAIAAYYYLKLIVYMFLKPTVPGNELVGANKSKPLVLIVGIAALVTTLSIFIIQPLLNYVTYMVSVSGY
ncbi:NADH-quinone oxidoreductase subunit NuoN [Nitratifractor salsuginis]|uniref:NADH-quinone oxidoreductase subunit N n=1 Tax=Nitratifractor salsuginis (strain DSM 16511 / JCM 12458 / E9I37-1) TaxID=749222 RepID=E6WYS3_NITSE|nr:NADH-quinone oxidoreductase subunit NuoN [Nitratifractor salsuginis]ADV45444.1 NADH dehydrogenase subunit N [Nitratifractor salsuginis DSM 16511]